MLKLGLHGRSLEELELACKSITTSKVNYSIEDENGGAVVVFSSADSDKVEPNLVCSVNQFLSALPLRHPSKALLHPNKTGDPSERLSQKIRESLDICREAIERYGLDSVALSFNGGKDCTVLLHLLREVIPKDKLKLLTFYFVPENSFPEVEDFSQGCVSDYNLDICRFQCSVREGLSKIEDNYPHIKAIFAGKY
jgi:asparagine synthetase B (glutamine-hydrolysing)